MQDVRYLLDRETETLGKTDADEFPLTVAPDWDELVSKANRMVEVIDKHLDFESKLQGRDLRPITLCPEQRISLVTDLSAV